MAAVTLILFLLAIGDIRWRTNTREDRDKIWAEMKEIRKDMEVPKEVLRNVRSIVKHLEIEDEQ